MLRRLNALWKRLEALESGERFQTLHREQQDKPPALKATYLGVAVASFLAGVVFIFIPGPAVLFFAFSGALLATQSSRVARALDVAELRGRKALDPIRARWRHRSR